MSLSKQDFDNYANQGFNRIPLMREVLADLEKQGMLKPARGAKKAKKVAKGKKK